MAAKPAMHPSADTLRALGLGKLDDATAAKILRHVETCPDCLQVVTEQSGDSFVNRLRGAKRTSGTPAPTGSLSGMAESLYATRPGGAEPAPLAGLPPELASNTQYQVQRELGRGGMGVVYLAKNLLMDRLEVLKVVGK